MPKLAILMSGFLPFIVFADEPTITLETVTVTSQKSSSPLFDSNASNKTQFQEQDTQERGMSRLQDLSKNVPNFSITDQSLGSFRQVFNMRGLVNTSIYSSPAVVFYVDDVAYSSTMTNMGLLFDMENVTVYRGAQPGLFGKNAYGGAVNMQTRQPENTLKSGLTVEVGTFDHYLVAAKSSGALIQDQLFFNLSGVYDRRAGFLSNKVLNNHPDSQENFSGKAAFTWKPSNTWDIRLTLTKDDFDYGNGRFTRLDNPEKFTTNADLSEQLKQNADSQSLRIAYQTENYNLLSVSSRRFWNMSPLLVDLDLNPFPAAMRNLNVKDETWSQEFRLSPKAHGVWDWHLGGFYSNNRYDEYDDLAAGGGRDLYAGVRRTDNYALFGKLAYQGFAHLDLYSELRMDYVHSTIDSTHTPIVPAANNDVLLGHYDTVFASPKWGLNYRFSEHGLLYASTGFGFKPGGFTYANNDHRAELFKQETLWHNSLGVKSDWFNNHLHSNISAFYYKIKNYQVERFFAGGNYSLFNAPKVSSYGFEADNQLDVMENLSFQSTVGYTHSHFDDYHDKFDGTNYTGNPVPFVPKFNASTALQYKHPQGYFARAEWLWKGKTYFNETRSAVLSQNDYSLLNLRIGYAKGGYSVYLFANNLTNSYYYTTKLGARGAPGDPRTLGIRLSVEF
jgi:iron complex outermembrane receptor protein